MSCTPNKKIKHIITERFYLGAKMLLPIVEIPQSIKEGLESYRDLFPRSETYQHIMEYCTGLIVLDKPSIKRLSQCLVNGSSQSSINKSLTQFFFL